MLGVDPPPPNLMNIQRIKNYTLVAAVVLTNAFLPGKVNADLSMVLSGTPGSSIITADFSGSSTATSGGGGVLGIGWNFVPSPFDPFPAQITGGDFGVFNFISGAPTMSINGVPQSMSGVFLQDSSNSPSPGFERFGTTGFSYTLSVGQVFEWSGTATFDVAGKGLTFSDFNPGTSGPIVTPVGGMIGQLTIVAAPVPEPGTALFGLALASGALARRRR